MTQQEINSIIIDYQNGLTLNELIKKYHHKHKIIHDVLTNNGIEIRSQGKKGQEKIVLDPTIEQKIINNYQSGKGLIASGKEFGVSYYKVKAILDKYNITCRNKHESIQIKNKVNRKYFCNENYFKTQSADMAYILGFLAADGTVRKDNNEIKITLAECDSELLEKIKDKLQFTGQIKHTITQDGFNIATLKITCEEYKKDLATYNIVPQKTFIFTIPQNIERKYMIDFIRGYWDGDGTICTAGAKSIKSSLCSAKKETLITILKFLEEEYNIPQVNIQEMQKVNKLYYFQYSVNATKKLFKALYYKKDLLYLQRKYNKFYELCVDNKTQEAAHPKCLDEKIC